MGVQTKIDLKEAQLLFPSYNFQTLQATKDGVMDTTYLLDAFILKKYERDISEQVLLDAKILQKFSKASLRVPLLVEQKSSWYLYTRLKGELPKNTHYYHIQALARFMAKMHRVSAKEQSCARNFLEEYSLCKLLKFTKTHFFFYYKKLQKLQNYKFKNDSFIHGDIFKDNTIFDGEHIAVFDFIDGGVGAFSFDIAVALISFNPRAKPSLTKLFLNTYNQNAPKKISIHKLHTELQVASQLYSLLRIDKHKSTKQAKLLNNFW